MNVQIKWRLMNPPPRTAKKKKIANLPSKMRSNVGNIHPLWEAGIFHLSVLFPGPTEQTGTKHTPRTFVFFNLLQQNWRHLEGNNKVTTVSIMYSWLIVIYL